MGGKCSRSIVLMGMALLLIAFATASCNASEMPVSSTQAATTTRMAKISNPCAAKAANPCNPCAAKMKQNPCNPCTAGSKLDPQLVTRPAGTKLFNGSHAELIKMGKQLWQDRTLGTSGLACQTCHLNHASFNPTFVQPYPHQVAMPRQRAGLPQVALDEMVQFCMIVPMASKPLPWASKELAALTAYVHEVQKDFIKVAAANPCMLKPKAANPCAAKNPCNPCAAKMKQNPCNPCAAKNPCAWKR